MSPSSLVSHPAGAEEAGLAIGMRVRLPLGEVLHKNGKLDEADAMLRSSLAIRAKALGEGQAATQAVLQELVA